MASIKFPVNEFIEKNVLDIYKGDFLDYSHRYNVYYGGAGSGKSVYVVQKLVARCIMEKRKMLFCRKVDRTVRLSIFAEVKDLIRKMGLTKHCTFNSTNMIIEFPNGSEIIFKGLQDVETIKSIQGITDVWVEEGDQITKKDWLVLDSRLRGKHATEKQMYICFNPCSKQNWTYTFFGFDTDIVPDNTIIFHSTYKDNRFLDPEYLKTIEGWKTKDPTHYKIYTQGQFCTLDKKVFDNWEVIERFEPMDIINKKLKSNVSSLDRAKYNPIYRKRMNKLQFLYASDIGYTDFTTICCVLADTEDKELYIFDEFYERFITNDMLIKAIHDMNLQKEKIVMDSAAAKDIAHLKKKGLNIVGAKKGKGSIMKGIRRLKEYKIFVSEDCPNAIMELENYCWTKDRVTGEYIDKPIDAYNHFIDALRYATEKIDKRSNADFYG